jgi:hypothetical protein
MPAIVTDRAAPAVRRELPRMTYAKWHFSSCMAEGPVIFRYKAF